MKNRQILAGIVAVVYLTGCGRQTEAITSYSVPASPSNTSVATTPPPESTNPVPHLLTPTLTAVIPTPTSTVNPSLIQHLSPGTGLDITYVQMLDPLNGWGIGGLKKSGMYNHIFRTKDGGLNWTDVTPPESAAAAIESPLTSVKGFFPDLNTAWATYHGATPSQVPANPVVWKTVDGGHTWTSSTPLDTSTLEIYSVSDIFFSGPSGWILAHVGGGMNHDFVALYRSTDGGVNWDRILDPYNDGGIQSCSKTGLYFSNKSDGWMTGNCNDVAPGALLFHSADGGLTWQSVMLPAPEDQADLLTSFDYACGIRAPVALASTLFLAVECIKYTDAKSEELTYLYRTDTGGADWTSLSYPGGDFYTIDGRMGWALKKDLFRTDDGGETWGKINTVPITWNGQLDFLSSQLGYGVAEKDSEYGLIRTTNGGVIWDLLSPVIAAAP